MQKTLLVKAALVASLFAVLLIPLQMIGGLVAERQGRQQEVVQEIAASSYGRQVFAGPFLSFPYVEEYEETLTEEKKDKTVTRVEQRRIHRTAVFFPASTACSRRACSAGRGARTASSSSTVSSPSRAGTRARASRWASPL